MQKFQGIHCMKSVHIFWSVSGLDLNWIWRDTKYLSLFSPDAGKFRPGKTSFLDTFPAVIDSILPEILMIKEYCSLIGLGYSESSAKSNFPQVCGFHRNKKQTFLCTIFRIKTYINELNFLTKGKKPILGF